MALSVEVIKILIFLLPGFITYVVRRIFIIPEKKELFEIILLSLIYTLVDYSILLCFAEIPKISIEPLQENLSVFGIFWTQFANQGGFWIWIISIVVGVVLGYISRLASFKFIGTILEKRLSIKRKGFRYVWSETLNSIKGMWVLVNLENGKKYQGWIGSFSDDAFNKELFLANATEILQDGRVRKIKGPGIMLTNDSKIVSIEFWEGE